MIIEIEGKKKLEGVVKIRGAKNSALPIIAASLLARDKVIIRNVPNISDVEDMLKICELFNVSYKFINNTISIDSSNIKYHDLDSDEVQRIRGSYYFLPIMLVLFKKVKMLECGGCRLGSRPIDLHLMAFEKMGCIVNEKVRYYDISYLDLRNTFVVFRRKSVGATINTLLLSMKTDYTVIINPAREPEVMDVISFLRKMGRSIFMYKNMLISCKGKKREVLDHTLIPDRIETLTYLILGAVAGRVKVINTNPKLIKAELKALKRIGVGLVINNNSIYTYKRKIKGMKIKAREYPHLSTDSQPLFTSLLAYAKGSSVIKDYVFKDRYSVVDELIYMGLNAVKGDNEVSIYPNTMIGTNVFAHDLRCGAALIIAASMAIGKTTIENAEIINRGYENIISNLRMLGLSIKKV